MFQENRNLECRVDTADRDKQFVELKALTFWICMTPLTVSWCDMLLRTFFHIVFVIVIAKNSMKYHCIIFYGSSTYHSSLV